MNYNFDIQEAAKYGLDEAVMLNNFKFWLRKNTVSNINIHDGKAWTYNSKRAYAELFPFWSEMQVKRILKSLIDQGVLITGNYNKIKFDRTLWYAVKDPLMLELPVGSNEPMEQSIRTNTTVQTNQPIPDNKTQIENNNNGFSSFWEKYGKVGNRQQAERAWNRLSGKDKKAASELLEQFRNGLPEFQERGLNIHASTYLNQKRWEDEPSHIASADDFMKGVK